MAYLNDTWIIESPEVPSICCQTKSSDHKDDKAKCATFLIQSHVTITRKDLVTFVFGSVER